MDVLRRLDHRSARRQGPEYSRTILELTEAKLGGRQWAGGDRYSIADIHLFRLYWRLRRAFDLGPNEFVGLEALHTRMLARPAVARTLEIEAALGHQPSSWSAK